MDTALQALTNSLDAINSRQAAARKRARKGGNATPFTTAVLNREKLDILTYIRDADPQLEASLFWYPPVQQSSAQSRPGPSHAASRSRLQSSSRNNNATRMNDENGQESDNLLAPRLPEPRHIAPPTPLRRSQNAKTKDFASSDDGPVDARVLLLAAQRLNDTYRRAPRARKHIKGLIKKHSSLTDTIQQYEMLIRENEKRLRAAADGKLPEEEPEETDTAISTPAEGTVKSSRVQLDLHRIQDAIQKEELEILALEEMIAELDQARLEAAKRESESRQRAEELDRVTSTPEYDETLRRDVSQVATTQYKSEEDEEADSTAQVPDTTGIEMTTELDDYAHHEEDEEPRPEQPSHDEDDQTLSADLHEAETTSFDEVREEGHFAAEERKTNDDQTAGNETITLLAPRADRDPSPIVHQQSQPEPIPQSSDELERVTVKVWDVFGDALRNVAPEREAADFAETLDILRALMSGGERSANLGDFSVGSTQTSSTQSTAVSESSTAVSAQLTPEILMTAFVISQMLVSPEPHRMNIDDLKVRGHEWWTRSGMQTWLRSRSVEESELPSQVEAFEDGQNLARKATYGMISKQLFAIKRQKGVGLVGFA